MEEPLPFGNPVPPQIRHLKLIVGFLALGVVSFGAIAFVVPAPGGTVSPQLRLALVVLGASAIPMAFVMHRVQLRHAPEDELARIARFSAATIIACALLEGVALFALVLFLLGRRPLDLIGAAVPVLLMVLAFFPTDARWRAYAETGR